jgi:hypothetical protein
MKAAGVRRLGRRIYHDGDIADTGKASMADKRHFNIRRAMNTDADPECTIDRITTFGSAYDHL